MRNPVFLDPGAPPLIGSDDELLFLEGFEQVLYWSAHLDATDGVMIDVSPNSIGNAMIPTEREDFAGFYDRFEGGDGGLGYDVNPVTGEPYPEQMVPRGDYARVLAEFWADGPHSETPPGHWFVLLNEVGDALGSEKRIGGEGPVVDALEWDVKSYFALGGGMHDSAISAWSVKGWYDFIRPISAIRWMAENGQRTDPDLPGFHPQGLELVPELVEMLTEESTAPGGRHEHLRGRRRRQPREDRRAMLEGARLHLRSGEFDRRLRMDPGRELVAVSTADLRESELRRVCLGSFDLQSGGGGDSHRADRIALVPSGARRIRGDEQRLSGLRGRADREHSIAMGVVFRRQ